MTMGGYQYESKNVRALRTIDSKTYNKDFSQNLIALNHATDYMAQYLIVMQKGIDEANKGLIDKFIDFIEEIIIIFGGGEATGFEWGDLKYIFQAIGALFGFQGLDGPANLVDAVWHMLTNFGETGVNFFILGIFKMLAGLVMHIPAVGDDLADVIMNVASALNLTNTTAVQAQSDADSAADAALSAEEQAIAAGTLAVEARDEAIAATDAASTAQATAETAEAQAGTAATDAAAAQSTANDANAQAEQAQLDAAAAQATADGAADTANTASTTAENANTTANAANDTANAASTAAGNAQTTADAAGNAAATAQSTADSASTAASNAQSTANTANTSASEAQTAAVAAQSQANGAVSTASAAANAAAAARQKADVAYENASYWEAECVVASSGVVLGVNELNIGLGQNVPTGKVRKITDIHIALFEQPAGISIQTRRYNAAGTVPSTLHTANLGANVTRVNYNNLDIDVQDKERIFWNVISVTGEVAPTILQCLVFGVIIDPSIED